MHLSFLLSPHTPYIYSNMSGLYIHIPFCSSRCIYCGFYSTTHSTRQATYISALCHEMQLRKAYISQPTTIYLGGGTPSRLTFKQLHQLFHQINLLWPNCNLGNTEITMECNPDDITPTFCDHLRYLPINRVSMGAQTFSNERLRFLHRRHTAEEVFTATHLLRTAGIKNISIDLMFGFPNETLLDWKEDLQTVLTLHPQHISAYSLMYEESTPLYRMQQKGLIKEISEESYLSMYNLLIDTLTENGYEHYEISNFAYRGSTTKQPSPYRSRHNSNYWNETPYLGIGAAAHSYNGHSRQWNVSDIDAYINAIEKGEKPCEKETLNTATKYNDLITTALRTRDGINLQQLQEHYPLSFYKYLIDQANPLINQGYIQIQNGHLYITRQGLYLSDGIMADLIYI